MRLTSVRIERYGHFADQQVALDPGRLNVVCAPNGAGKSVFRTACADLLFGIAGQSPMNFRFDYKLMKLSAEAIGDDGAPFRFGRRKGLGNTLLDGAGNPADPALLARHLGAATRATLEQLFALDTERLRDGGANMLKSGGQVADALLSAGGLPHAQALRRALEQAADALAPTRRFAGRPFYAAGDRFVAARAMAAKALLRPDAWEAQRGAQRDAEARLAAARQAAAGAVMAKTRLERLRRVRPTVAALDAAQAWLGAHPDAPALPPTARETLDIAVSEVLLAAEQERAEASRRDLLRGELDAMPEPNAVLLQAEALDALGEQAGGVAKALADLPPREAELAELRLAIVRKQRDLGKPGSDPASLIPPRTVLTRTRQLIREHGGHETACRTATRLRDELARSMAARRGAMDALPPAQDVSDLRALIARIRAQGDPAAQARELAARLSAANTALARALADVPFWREDDDALRALTLPAPASLDRAHAALVRAEAAAARQDDVRRAAEAGLAEAKAALAAVLQAGPVPDRDAVAQARADRQRLWSLVARLAFDRVAPDAAALASLPGQSLAQGYEQAVRDADAVADRRADESALVERAAAAARFLTAARQRLEAEQARQTASDQACVQALHAWRTELPAALPAASRLAEVTSFVDARARVLDRWAMAEEARLALAALSARQDAWTASLRALMPNGEAAKAPAVPEAEEVTELLDRADERVGHAAKAGLERDRAAADIVRLETQLRDAEHSCRQSDADRQAWEGHWTACLQALGRRQEESPDEVEETLGLLTDLAAELTRADGVAQRIADMRADNAAFATNVASVSGQCDGPPAAPAHDAAGDEAAAALAALRMLRGALAASRETETRRVMVRRQCEQAARQAAELGVALTARRDRLAGVLAGLDAATPAEAELRVASAEARAQHAAAEAAALARLREDADGMDLDALREELAARDADAVARELYTASEALDEAQEQVALHAAEAATLRHDLAQREAETLYNEAVAAQSDAAAAAGRIFHEAAVARLAACLLGSALEAVERQGTPAMLRRIGEVFCMLTGGAYPVIGTDEQESGAVLRITDAALPDRPKLVGELSEGTRDQLYLALRIAAIETHPVRLPFIADDILQTSDDTRAEAALKALAALSERTQVILLTHHEHIAALAEQTLGAALQVSRLTP